MINLDVVRRIFPQLDFKLIEEKSSREEERIEGYKVRIYDHITTLKRTIAFSMLTLENTSPDAIEHRILIEALDLLRKKEKGYTQYSYNL